MASSGFIINPLDAQYDSEGTPLIMAVRALNIDLVKELLKQGVDVNKTDYSGNTAITVTINTPAGGKFSEHIKLKIIRALIKKGADISIPDYKNASPLNNAAEKGYIKIVKELIKHNSDQAAELTKDNYGCDFYDRLSDEGKKWVDEHYPRIGKIKDFQQDVGDMCAFIITKNRTPLRNLYNADYGNKQTLLIKACMDQNVDLVRILIKDGDHINRKDRFGNTALIYAAKQNNKKLMDLLISSKAKKYLQNKEHANFYDCITDEAIKKEYRERFPNLKIKEDSEKFGL